MRTISYKSKISATLFVTIVGTLSAGCEGDCKDGAEGIRKAQSIQKELEYDVRDPARLAVACPYFRKMLPVVDWYKNHFATSTQPLDKLTTQTNEGMLLVPEANRRIRNYQAQYPKTFIACNGGGEEHGYQIFPNQVWCSFWKSPNGDPRLEVTTKLSQLSNGLAQLCASYDEHASAAELVGKAQFLIDFSNNQLIPAGQSTLKMACDKVEIASAPAPATGYLDELRKSLAGSRQGGGEESVTAKNQKSAQDSDSASEPKQALTTAHQAI